MTNVKKSLKKLGALALCLCLALALLPTAAFADVTDITVSSTRGGESYSSDAQYWKWYDITLTDSTGATDAVYTGTMQYTVTNTGSSSTAYAAVMGYTGSYSYSGSGTSQTVTWTFENATLAELRAMVASTWIYTPGTENEGGSTGIGFTDSVTFSALTTTTTYTVSGTVYDVDGNAASGASVVFTDTSDSTNTETVTTDTNGSYEVSLPEGTYSYTVTSSDSLQGKTGTVNVSANATENITMEVVAYNVSVGLAAAGDGSGSASVNGESVTIGETDKTQSVSKIVSKGETATIVITPNSGCYVTYVFYDGGTSEGLQRSGEAVTETKESISAKFSALARFDKYVTVTGTVTAGGDATPALPATITFTDSCGLTYTADVGEDGRYTIQLPQDKCSYVVTSNNGLQSATSTEDVEITSTTTTLDITMTNTETGTAVLEARDSANTKIDEAATAAKAAIDAMENLSPSRKNGQQNRGKP